MTERGAPLDRQLLAFADRLSLDREMRAVAERIRDEAINDLTAAGANCADKQALARSLEVLPGTRAGEYLVVSSGDYGRKLEFGTKNSPEWPWLIPALVKVKGSIHNCLQQALSKAVARTGRLHGGR